MENIYILIENKTYTTQIHLAHKYQTEAYNSFMNNINNKHIEYIKYNFDNDIVFSIKHYMNVFTDMNTNSICVMVTENGKEQLLSNNYVLLQKISNFRNRLLETP